MSWNRPPARVKQYAGDHPSAPRAPAVRVADGRAQMVVPVPKLLPKRSAKYRRWVASLACMHCNRPAPSQCAHADEGKGMATKTTDETCFPLCVACHLDIGSKGCYTKSERREFEAVYGARTRLRALTSDQFPKEWL